MISSKADKKNDNEFRVGWRILVAATLGSAFGLTSLPFYTLGTFIRPLQDEFDWGRGDIASSWLYSTVVLAVVAPLLGIVADRIGTRVVTLVSIPCFALTLYFLSSFSGSLSKFHLIFAIAALVGGGATPVNYTRAVSEAFQRGRGLALGISLAGIGIAAIVLPVAISSINASYGWRSGYLTLAVLALLPWPFVFFGLPSAIPAVAPRNKRSVRLLSSPVFWTMAPVFAAVAVAVSALIVHMVPMLRDAGFSSAEAASTASLIGIGVLIGRIGAGYLMDRVFAPHLAAIMFTCTAAGCILLATVGVGAAPLVALLIGLSLGAEVDLMAYLTAKYFGLNRYAFIYGIIYALFTLGGAVGPTLAGAIFDHLRSYSIVIWGVGALLLVAAAGILRLPSYPSSSNRTEGSDDSLPKQVQSAD